MSESPARARLNAGLSAMDLDPQAPVRDRLLDYVALLDDWNRVFNLTAVRDPAESVTRHLLDSLTLLPYLPPGALLDLGTGAGLPGLVIAVAEPDRPVVLLDSIGKKTRFLTQAVATLGLDNVKVVRCRAQDFESGPIFPVVTSRAFAALSRFVELGLPFCRRQNGVLLAMKGQYPGPELDDLPDSIDLEAVHRVRVPGLDADRHIVSLRPTRESS